MIPYYDLKSVHSGEVLDMQKVACEVIKSGDYIFGTDKFEEEFADFVGSNYCVGVNSGTSALHLALISLGIKSGDEVITVSHTFRATISAIKYLGAVPVFVDIDPETFLLDADLVESKITSRTKAILPVHMYGNVVNLDSLKKFNLPILEDCSQAHGSYHNNNHVGSSNVGTFSFYPGKGLGALGDAGCIVVNDQGQYDELKSLRSWDKNSIGFNYRMDNLQGEFLRIKLKNLKNVISAKRGIADEYDKHFKYSKTDAGNHNSYHIYPILVKNRVKFFKEMHGKVELKCHYETPVHKQELLRCEDETKFDLRLPITERISSCQVSLPIYPTVDHEKVINSIMDNKEYLI